MIRRASRRPLLGSAFVVAIAFLFSSCVSDGRYRPLPSGEGPPIGRVILLREEQSISTLHFPRGVYRLEAEDDSGYYYRAPRQLTKHAFAGLQPYDGGIFRRKSDLTKLRGYVVWAAGRTKIGDLSRADLEIHGE